MAYKVKSQLQIGGTAVLTLDKPITEHNYRNYLIGKKIYEIVPVYDLPRSIAIKSTQSFVGKTVVCV